MNQRVSINLELYVIILLREGGSMGKTVKIKLAESMEDLDGILKLQEVNHYKNLDVTEKGSNGFVTVKHDMELLKKMNKKAGQVIAVYDKRVVGYALVMLKEFCDLIPVLKPMFRVFRNITYNGKSLDEFSYYVMGQICIADKFRGRGIFEEMYTMHKDIYSNQFELCLTEVSQSNERSMRAHHKVGFKNIYHYEDETDNWNVLLWDWT